jgi:hypothetical protein
MASGRLGAADIAATTNTTLYTVPSGKYAVLSLNIVNRNTTTATVRVALTSTDTPTDAEWIEYDANIGAKGVLERTGIVLDSGKKVVVYSSVSNVSCVVVGIEEIA